jgi:hypothetical protein
LYNSLENARRLGLANRPVGRLIETKSVGILSFSQWGIIEQECLRCQ